MFNGSYVIKNDIKGNFWNMETKQNLKLLCYNVGNDLYKMNVWEIENNTYGDDLDQ